nr:DNA repair protein [Clostridia bacterium]
MASDKKDRIYIAIDLKSYYASVECVERGLDPMTTDLVVADPERTKGTICLAVSVSLKKKGVKNRCRLFEIPSYLDGTYIIAVPRMRLYIEKSAEIYSIYLKYFSHEDIHVYSVDECFIDVTDYLRYYGLTPIELARTLMEAVSEQTRIPSTAGIGTNLYLSKIAMDIIAKHNAERIGYLNEELYRDQLWDHLPLTDFWQIGPGTERRLANIGLYTLKDVAYADQYLLKKTFGINGELLFDHAWGREPVLMKHIHSYRSKGHSLSNGQVLPRAYSYEEGLLAIKEQTEVLVLDMSDKGLVTDLVVMWIGYEGKEHYGNAGNIRLNIRTNAYSYILENVEELYHRICNPSMQVRRLGICFNDVVPEEMEYLDLFTDYEQIEKERRLQRTIVSVRKRFGPNSILKAMNLEEAGMTTQRNVQIGGHSSDGHKSDYKKGGKKNG